MTVITVLFIILRRLAAPGLGEHLLPVAADPTRHDFLIQGFELHAIEGVSILLGEVVREGALAVELQNFIIVLRNVVNF